jgi:hypothetical protein
MTKKELTSFIKENNKGISYIIKMDAIEQEDFDYSNDLDCEDRDVPTVPNGAEIKLEKSESCTYPGGGGAYQCEFFVKYGDIYFVLVDSDSF